MESNQQRRTSKTAADIVLEFRLPTRRETLVSSSGRPAPRLARPSPRMAAPRMAGYQRAGVDSVAYRIGEELGGGFLYGDQPRCDHRWDWFVDDLNDDEGVDDGAPHAWRRGLAEALADNLRTNHPLWDGLTPARQEEIERRLRGHFADEGIAALRATAQRIRDVCISDDVRAQCFMCAPRAARPRQP